MTCATPSDAQGIAKPIATDSLKRRPLVLNATFIQSKPVIPQDYYAKQLGFFCKQEIKMQQIHVPVTFRVGSMDDCNRLEQKPGYR